MSRNRAAFLLIGVIAAITAGCIGASVSGPGGGVIVGLLAFAAVLLLAADNPS